MRRATLILNRRRPTPPADALAAVRLGKEALRCYIAALMMMPIGFTGTYSHAQL